MKKLFLTMFILLSILILSSCNDNVKVDILTTQFITYDLTKVIAANDLNVDIIASPHQSFHKYEPTSKELMKINQADVFVFLGFEYEIWLENESTLKNYMKNDAVPIWLTKDLHIEDDHHEDDHIHASHVWTDPSIVVTMLENITNSLSSKYPELAFKFNARYISYVSELNVLIQEFNSYLKTISNKTVYFIGHNSQEPFADFFNIEINPLIESMNPSSDLTSLELTNFITLIKEQNIKYLFIEETTPPDFLRVFYDEIPNLTINSLQGFHLISTKDLKNGLTYKDLLNRNIIYIKEALS